MPQAAGGSNRDGGDSSSGGSGGIKGAAAAVAGALRNALADAQRAVAGPGGSMPEGIMGAAGKMQRPVPGFAEGCAASSAATAMLWRTRCCRAPLPSLNAHTLCPARGPAASAAHAHAKFEEMAAAETGLHMRERSLNQMVRTALRPAPLCD